MRRCARQGFLALAESDRASQRQPIGRVGPLQPFSAVPGRSCDFASGSVTPPSRLICGTLVALGWRAALGLVAVVLLTGVREGRKSQVP
jgi:hypothetical protein